MRNGNGDEASGPAADDPQAEIAALRERLAAVERDNAQLREAEGRLRSLLDHLRDIVFYRGDPDGTVRVFGSGAGTLARELASGGQVDLDAWYACLHPDDREAYLEAERRRRREGQPFSVEFRYFRPDDGAEAWAREVGYAVPTDDGRQFNDGYVIDITEAKRREHDRREAMEAALVASRAKSEFLANMSHELRTPLNAVIGFAEILLTEAFGPLGAGRYREYSRDIHASAVHLKQLIDDILDVSKVEAGKAELHETRIDLTGTIASTLRMVRERAATRDVALSVDLAPDLPLVTADEGKLRQVLLNLLSNAVKFTPPGGSVTVVARLGEDGGVRLAVADTGIGMAAEDIPRALEPFVQLHGGLSRSFEGTGLGLPLSAKLVELHGGRLEIDSTPRQGTTVTVAFPPERTLRPAGPSD
ncbi:MAG: PAS domain-containing protein [Alphaproteobacteria bacterium]|nr:PAS domain-containing protein [Alphaproteobacteria bacterium]